MSSFPCGSMLVVMPSAAKASPALRKIVAAINVMTILVETKLPHILSAASLELKYVNVPVESLVNHISEQDIK